MEVTVGVPADGGIVAANTTKGVAARTRRRHVPSTRAKKTGPAMSASVITLSSAIDTRHTRGRR